MHVKKINNVVNGCCKVIVLDFCFHIFVLIFAV